MIENCGHCSHQRDILEDLASKNKFEPMACRRYDYHMSISSSSNRYCDCMIQSYSLDVKFKMG